MIVVTCSNGEWAATANDLNHAAQLVRLLDTEVAEAAEDGSDCRPHRVVTGKAAWAAEAAQSQKGE